MGKLVHNIFLLPITILLLSGCGAKKENNEAAEASLTPIRNEKAAIAAWEEKSAEFYDLNHNFIAVRLRCQKRE